MSAVAAAVMKVEPGSVEEAVTGLPRVTEQIEPVPLGDAVTGVG